MKIFIICSKNFYGKVTEIKSYLEDKGHKITLPNCYDDPQSEDRYRGMGREDHSEWKSKMIRHSEKVIGDNDAVLVLNFEKKSISNYIGGATFLEMYDAFRLGKKIFMYNDIPEGLLADEIIGFRPVVINGNLDCIV
jgi:hypothetical protein